MDDGLIMEWGAEAGEQDVSGDQGVLGRQPYRSGHHLHRRLRARAQRHHEAVHERWPHEVLDAGCHDGFERQAMANFRGDDPTKLQAARLHPRLQQGSHRGRCVPVALHHRESM